MNLADTLGIVMDICEDAITVCKLGTTSARSYNVCKKYLYTHGTFGEGDPDRQYEYPRVSNPINHSFGQISLHATSLSPPHITSVYYLSYKGTRYVFPRDEIVDTIQISNTIPHEIILSNHCGPWEMRMDIGKCVRIYRDNLVLMSAEDSHKLSMRREWLTEPVYLSRASLDLGRQLLEDTHPGDYVYDALDEYDFSNAYYSQSV